MAEDGHLEDHEPARPRFTLEGTGTISVTVSLAQVTHMAVTNLKGVERERCGNPEGTGSVHHGLYAASETAGEGVGESPEHSQTGKQWWVNPTRTGCHSRVGGGGGERSHVHIDPSVSSFEL